MKHKETTFYPKYFKRAFDLLFSCFALSFMLPFFLVIAVLISLDSKGSPLFFQKRVGKGGRYFYLIKFRSMTPIFSANRREFSPGDDRRVTQIGKILRRTKIDELPELLNVFLGDMSLVGPRPEVPSYTIAYPDLFDPILEIRPGLSDYASIKYRNEEEILSKQSDPDQYYLQIILPDKLLLSRSYIRAISFRTDLKIIAETIRFIL